MYRVGILLFIISVRYHIVTGGDPPNTLDFSCDDDKGTMTIKSTGLDTYESIFAFGSKKIDANNIKDEQPCSVRENRTNSNKEFTITDCIQDKPVTVYIMKIWNPNQNTGQSGVGTTRAPNQIIIGGDGIAAYTLECFVRDKVNTSNLVANIEFKKVFDLVQSSTLSPMKTENSVFVWMSIWKGDATVQSSTSVLIGDPLLVVISGPAGPTYYVKSCIAYAKSNRSLSIALLSDGIVMQNTLMTTFSQTIPTNLTALKNSCKDIFCVTSSLYAFHFKDSNDLTLECTIKACPLKGGDCSGSNSFTSSPSQRRRRESDSQLYVKNATIMVHDFVGLKAFEGISNGNLLKSSYCLIGAIALVWGFGRFD